MTRPKTVDAANGKWRDILTSLGIDDFYLDGKHHACPATGEGKDRFRFDDGDGKGNGGFFCQCDHLRNGSGDGVQLVMCCKRLSWRDACAEIDRVVGNAQERRASVAQGNPIDAVRRIAEACAKPGEAVARYLAGRGLEVPPGDIRQATLKYYVSKDECAGTFETMVCFGKSAAGKVTSAHITYLAPNADATEYTKALLNPARKVRGNKAGAAIRLYPLPEGATELGIAEGIETAIAARQIFDVPTWSCFDAGNLEDFVPPAGIETLHIFADHDEAFAGQAAAFACALRNKRRGVNCIVHMPPRAATDWNDVLLETRKAA